LGKTSHLKGVYTTINKFEYHFQITGSQQAWNKVFCSSSSQLGRYRGYHWPWPKPPSTIWSLYSKSAR